MQNSQIFKNTNSWDEFAKAITPLTNKGQGDAFEDLVELYLQIDPVYRIKLKTIWHHTKGPLRPSGYPSAWHGATLASSIWGAFQALQL